MPIVIRKICQIWGFLLLVSTLFFALSVGSYSSHDPSWNHYMSYGDEVIHNRGGVIGALLADWGLQVLGSTVFLLMSMTVVSAFCLMRVRLATVLGVCWRGVFLLAALSTMAHLWFPRDPFFGDQGGNIFAGGVSGKWCVDFLMPYLHALGIYLLAASVVAVTLLVGVRHYPGYAKAETGLRTFTRAVWSVIQGLTQGACYAVNGVAHGFCTLRRQRTDVPRQASVEEKPAASEELVAAGSSAESSSPQPQGAVFTTDSEALPAGQPAQRHEACAGPSEAIPTVHFADLTSELSEAIPPLDEHVKATRVDQPDQSDVPPVLPSVSSALVIEVHEQDVPSQPRPMIPKVVRPRSQAVEPPRIALTPPQTLLRLPLAPGTLPALELLDAPPSPQQGQSGAELFSQARFLEQKLREFGVDGEVVQVLPGPVITMYEFAPAAGVKVSRIVNLQDDLALVMRALSVRVVAPIPGKAVVGVEIPNRQREMVVLRELLDTQEFRTSSSKLSMALGKDILGKLVITDLALIPHLLIAGATGSGKSVGVNSLICSLLFHSTPDDVKMIMIDPKMLELSIYDGIPHLLIPVVTDAKKAAVALRRVVAEMERRYQLLAARGVRSIAQYNQMMEDEQRQRRPEEGVAQASDNGTRLGEKLPYLVVVIDELSDLMMVSSREVEDSLMRIAQMARAAGIHLIVATQRPSVDVLTGVIKANFPARISFQVTSKTDSRTILDANGAEKLLGRGDMLFLAPGTSKSQRIHGAYVSEAEINRLVAAWKAVEQPHYDASFLTPADDKVDVEDEAYDEKFDEAVALVAKTGQASISMLQRRLRVGYNRAARMIEMMEKDGIVGPSDGVKPREVLVRHLDDDV